MKDKFLEFLEKEREISIYKIDMLNRGNDKAYKKRLIRKEQEFINFPFQELDLTSVEELKEAVELFRDDRELFDKKWKLNQAHTGDAELKNLVTSKIEFFEKIFSFLIEDEIRQTNIVQNKRLREFLSVEEFQDGDCGLDTINKIEGIRSAKKRARIQILIYCLARYINNRIKSIKESLIDHDCDIKLLDYHLNNMMEFGPDNLFRYYNQGIKEVPLIINGTIGNNNHVASVYPLINYCNLIKNSNLEIKRVEDAKVYSYDGKPLPRKAAERAYGIELPLNRVGNEWMKVLSCQIYSASGRDISSVINYKDFYNLFKSGSYIKAIPLIPIWEILSNLDKYNFQIELLELFQTDSLSIKGQDLKIYDAINSSNGTIKIDCQNSTILIPATRSESDHIEDSLEWIKILINKIMDDYKTINWKEYGYQ